MSAMGRSCVNTIKRSRQNVAIATQVLNPSAIGGSLRGQRRLKHFGPPDDDEEEFIFYQRRAAWKKLGFYGAAILVTILILMGVVLAVGYLQTKNSNDNVIASRSVKLIQEVGKPFSYIYSSQTTPDPPSVEPTYSQEFSPTSHSSFLRGYTKDESDSSGKIASDDMYFSTSKESDPSSTTGEHDDYLVEVYNVEDDKDQNQVKNAGENANDFLFNGHPFPVNHHSARDDDDHDHKKSSSANEQVPSIPNNKEEDDDSLLSNHKLDNDLDTEVVDNESVYNDANGNNDDWKSKGSVDNTNGTLDYNIKEKNDDELPTEEKANHPNGSVFSLEIPIYSQNKTNGGFQDSPEQNSDYVEVSEPTEQSKPHGTDQSDKLTSEELMTENKENSESDQLIENNFFRQALLHTSLFPLDDDKKTTTKPGATAIIIEDLDSDDSPSSIENLDSAHPNRNKTRNHKVKILKNDKVMNMKATYAPEGFKQSHLGSAPATEKNIHSSESNNAEQAPKSRSRNGGRRNGTTSEWRLRLRTNKEKIDKNKHDKDDILDDNKSVFKSEDLQQSKLFPLNQNYAQVGETGALFGQKPRLLSASSLLPSFESFLKAILSNVQQAGPKKSDGYQKERPTNLGASGFGMTSYTNNDLDHLLPASTLPSPSVEQDPSLFRKRTIISEHDIFDYPTPMQPASPPQAENYFDRLLGQYPTVGTIGNPSATGASLNSFQSHFPFPTAATISSTTPFYDINQSGTNDAARLAPGVVPLDLASSFIPAGLTKPQYSGQQSQIPFTSPYATHNLYDNFGDPSSFSFQNIHPKANTRLGIGTVTTSAGQPPTYNTISQGMHLLNLISGTIPSTYYHDQVYHPGHTTTAPTPTFQNDGFTTTPSFHFSSPASTNNFVPSSNSHHQFHNLMGISSPESSHQRAPELTFEPHSFDYHPEASSNNGHVRKEQSTLSLPLIARALAIKSDREALEKFLEDDDNDQVPAASSFSQNILTTLQKPRKKSTTSAQEPVTTTAGSIITLMTKPKARTTNMFRTSPPIKNNSSPKSFSFEILPQKNLTSQMSPNTFSIDDNNVFSLANEDLYPSFDDASTSRSKKKSSANLSKAGKALAFPNFHNSEMSVMNYGESKDFKKSLPANKFHSKDMNLNEKRARKVAVNVAGLKSGFFT